METSPIILNKNFMFYLNSHVYNMLEKNQINRNKKVDFMQFI